ncbi:MAG: hypothetical protein OEZ43_13760 [Gammaproteobacteria bacterium]|nr:hypothetical protein [Gammaproteobacteria bacterium]
MPVFTLDQWKSHQMKDYTQHLAMNCGGTAATFAIYGLVENVPESAIRKLLIQESVPGKKLETLINQAGKDNIRASSPERVKTANYGDVNPHELGGLSSEVLEDIYKDMLTTNGYRCVIQSCHVSKKKESSNWYKDPHWQTWYLSKNGELRSYNAWPYWTAATIKNTFVGTPVGFIAVSGPRIREQAVFQAIPPRSGNIEGQKSRFDQRIRQ